MQRVDVRLLPGSTLCMESVAEDWKQLSPEELMAKKDAIEAEMSACNTVLESVSAF